MKIVIIVWLFPPKRIAGTEIVTYLMAGHLAGRGHEVHVVTSLDEGLPEESCEKGFYVHRIPLIKIPVFYTLFFWYAIIRMIGKIEPDLVHAQDLGIGMPALISKKMYNIPYLVWAQGFYDIYSPDGFTKLFLKPVIKNADSAIALTEDMKGVMQNIYHRDIAVLPNGINLAEYIDEPGIKDKTTPGKVILFVGRLDSVKGVQYLIRAMKRVHTKIPKARLIIVGDGPEREMLESLSLQLGIQKAVQFIGKVPHEKVKIFMQQADIFVLPSLCEGFPGVIIEAMACGLPVVSSRVGGIPEIITNDANGYLADAKDAESIADYLLLLLQDEKLRKKISYNNKQLVKKYSWENVIVRLERLYQLSIK